MPQVGDIKFGREIGRTERRRRFIWVACPECKQERWVVFIVNTGKPINERCSRCSGMEQALKFKRYLQHGLGEANPHWRKGRIVRSDGYIGVYVPPNDFFYPMASKDKYVLEHRLIMAKHLGRCLLSWETVHHKGTKYPSGSMENRADNRIENLELLPNPNKHDALTRMASYIKKLERELAILKRNSQRT